MNGWFSKLKKLGTQTIMRLRVCLLYIAQFFKRIEDTMHCGSGKPQSTGNFLKRDGLLFGPLLDKVLKQRKNLSCDADIGLVYLLAFGTRRARFHESTSPITQSFHSSYSCRRQKSR